ncbi:MAG TPA: EAL domain-containing protein [Myxococcales bacterium]
MPSPFALAPATTETPNTALGASATPSPGVAQPDPLSESFDLALAKLWLNYQPIVSAQDGAVFGYEALLRTSEPTLPTPGLLLDAAERLDRTMDLGRLVRSRAPLPFSDAPAEALLFVNLHPQELLDPLLYLPESTLSSFAPRTVLEITERAAIRDLSELADRVRRLRSLGFRIAVDDLGAGYAGLTSFADLAPEFVKLDMSLVRDVDKDSLRQRIVRSMASLCREVGAQVVAEGIERAGERDAVVSLGCDYVQGYFVARPDRPFPETNW